MKKSLFLCGILISFAFSAPDKQSTENYLENTNPVDNTKTAYTTEYQDATKLDGTKGYFNYREVVYDRIIAYRSDFNKANDLSNATKFSTYDVQGYQKKLQEDADKLSKQEAEQKKAEDAKDIFAQGYCRFRNDIEVSKISEYSYLDCQFNDIGNATLAVLIVPDFYAKALVAQPLYLSVSDEYGNSKRLNTTNGAVLNATKTSINIANLVNDFMLEKILASTSYQSATIATTQAKSYLDAKNDARKNEQLTYVPTGDGTSQAIKTTNSQMPDKVDYITGATIELVSSLVKTIGKSVLSDISYSFKINKGSMVYADVVISGKTNSSNNGGLIKKTKLINKDSTNEIKEDGSYDFIPKDNDLEIEIDGNKKQK